MPFPDATIQADLELALLTRLRGDPDLGEICQIGSDIESGREAQKGSIFLGVELQDLSSTAPGTGRYVSQAEEAMVLLTLGLQGRQVEAHQKGWRIIRHARTLITGLMPEISDSAYSANTPGFFHLESAAVGRDGPSQASIFASLYQINLTYSQRLRN